MHEFILPLLQAPEGGTSGGGPGWTQFIIFIPIIAIFYFLIIRPQNKKQKETQKMLSALKKGDRIVTIGGVHGTIQSIKDQSIIVKVDENTKIEFSRSAVSSVETAAREDKDKEKEEKREIEAPADESEKK